MRKVLTYFTDKKTGLEKSGNSEKSGEVFSDIELVKCQNWNSNLGLTPVPLQLMTEEQRKDLTGMQSSAPCTGFSQSPLAQHLLP